MSQVQATATLQRAMVLLSLVPVSTSLYLLSDFCPTLSTSLVNAPASHYGPVHFPDKTVEPTIHRHAKQVPCTSIPIHGLGAMRCELHHLLSVRLQPWHISDARAIPMRSRLFSSRKGPPVLSLDVTIAPHEADTSSHLFLLLPPVTLQDSEYQLVLGNAIRSASDRMCEGTTSILGDAWFFQVVPSISPFPQPTWQDPFGEWYSCPRQLACVEELTSRCTIPYFYGNHRVRFG